MINIKLKLNDGCAIPQLGLGVWQIPAGRKCEAAVLAALEAGYRHIDTASFYGNEESVGAAVKASGIGREEIFVTTKLWNRDQGYESALSAFDESLKRLSLEYIDLYLIHWPGHNAGARLDSWRALTELHEGDQAKSIGVSNYEVRHLEELLEKSSLVPTVNQIEFHPFIYDKQLSILEFCKAQGIVVEAYSPLNRGHNMNEPVLEGVARQHGKSVVQVMLRWAIQHGTVPIPKSAHPERIRENLEIFDFELTKDEMHAVNQLGRSKSALPFYVKLIK